MTVTAPSDGSRSKLCNPTEAIKTNVRRHTHVTHIRPCTHDHRCARDLMPGWQQCLSVGCRRQLFSCGRSLTCRADRGPIRARGGTKRGGAENGEAILLASGPLSKYRYR